MKIYLYEVFIPKDNLYENEFEKKLFDSVAENDELIVLNDRRFTTINKAPKLGSDLNKTLNKFTVSEWKTGIKSIDGIRYSEYSDHAVRPSTIRNRIQRFIDSEYSWIRKINLDFIKDTL